MSKLNWIDHRHPVLTVNLPLLTIPLRQDQILISKFLVGKKTSEVIENADESGFGEGHAPAPDYGRRELQGPSPAKRRGVMWVTNPGRSRSSAGGKSEFGPM